MKNIVATFALFLLASCSNYGEYDGAAVEVGNYLVSAALSSSLFNKSNTAHKGIVRVGDGLKEKLLEIKSNLNSSCLSKLIDNNNDSEASHLIVIICNEKPVLGLRLKYDDRYQAFHILGWWTSGL